jgi:hypothetical protein
MPAGGLTWTWCLAVVLFGWPAYGLFRLLEPCPARVAVAVRPQAAKQPALVIQTV